MKKYQFQLILGLSLLFLISLSWKLGWFMSAQNSLQNAFYDVGEPSPEIVIVTIDEKTLDNDHLGALSKWKRTETYGKAVEILRDANVAAIGIDVTLPNYSTHGVRDDQKFSGILKETPNVVLPARTYYEDGVQKAEFPNPSLIESGTKLGWINVRLDEDGFVRAIPVLQESPEGVIEAFSLAISRIKLKEEALDYRIAGDKYDFTPSIQIPVTTLQDKKAGVTLHEMNVNYFAAPNQFTQVSMIDLLEGRLIDKKGQAVNFENKIVLIGPTAIDLQDMYLSPVSKAVKMAGVEIHANAIQTLLNQRFIIDEPLLPLALTIILVLLINIVAFSLIRVRFSLLIVLLEGIGIMISALSAYSLGVILNVVYPLLAVFLSFTGSYTLSFVLEQKEKRFIEGAFSRYVNKDVVKSLIKHPEALKLGGEKRELTVYFSDITGFTSLSEKMEPEKLVTFLNGYLSEMTEIIQKHQGTVDKFEGDAIMAFWNAPLDDPHHAENAALAALECQKKLSELRTKWKAEGLPELTIRIGLNSGEAVVGNMGSKTRFNYTAMGDNINLGSRLEGINKQYGTEIMISEMTHEKVQHAVLCRELDMIRVKGKNEPVRIFELIDVRDVVNMELQKKLEQFAEALKKYRKQEFQAAKTLFEKNTDDKPSQVFVKRCEEFIKNPPESNWDGVWTFNVK